MTFSGAKHAFMNPAADKLGMEGVGYNEPAARRAWEYMRLFFGELFLAAEARIRNRPFRRAGTLPRREDAAHGFDAVVVFAPHSRRVQAVRDAAIRQSAG